MKAPIAATQLGFAGLIPFIGLAVVAAFGAERYDADARQALLLYGGVILSFMGGCRWGFAAAGLGTGPQFAPLALSVLPALLAWAALWALPEIGPNAAALTLAAGFAILYAWDVLSAQRGDAPAWWPKLRLPLTAGAVAALVSLLLT